MSARRAPYGVREFDLSTARTNEKITIRADNFAILTAEDAATIRVNSPDASPIPVREISGLTISGDEGEPGIQRIYLSNNSGTGKLRLLTGFGVASGDTSTPTDDTTDVSDRAARELGKARVEDSGGVLVDPATDGADTPDLREIANWSAGTLTVTDDGNFDVDSNATLTAPALVTDVTSSSGSGSAAQLQLGKERAAFDVYYDFASDQTLEIEVSKDGSTWRTFKQVTTTQNGFETEDTAYEYVRAYAAADVNTIEMSGKGVF